MGATCYMNSIMQQFFMIPSFRYHLLATEKASDIEEFDKKNASEKQDIFERKNIV